MDLLPFSSPSPLYDLSNSQVLSVIKFRPLFFEFDFIFETILLVLIIFISNIKSYGKTFSTIQITYYLPVNF